MTATEYIAKNRPLKPGARIFACSFSVAENGRKLVKNMSPCFVELCCGFQEQSEDKCRALGMLAGAVVPVAPDGSLLWKQARELWQVCLSGTMAGCVADMRSQINTARQVMAKNHAALDATDAKIQAVADDLLTLELKFNKEDNV